MLSVEETATLLGETRSTLYRAIKAGTQPFPIFVIGERIRIPRRAIDRLLDGFDPMQTNYYNDDNSSAEPNEATLAPTKLGYTSSNRRPTCSAARRSSSRIASV